MKKQTFILFTPMNKEDMADLTKEVKETIAFGLVVPHIKTFTAAELWNIQREGKTRIQRRFIF